ncbi:MAG TPA: hypothetical protein VFM18_13795 [Methanosarcina sp.]|nr:hypothetical protein [Methanosarcina sp.]
MTTLNEIFEKSSSVYMLTTIFEPEDSPDPLISFRFLASTEQWNGSLKDLIESKSPSFYSTTFDLGLTVRKMSIEIARNSRRGIGNICIIPDKSIYDMISSKFEGLPGIQIFHVPEMESGYVYVINHINRPYIHDKKTADGPFAILEDGSIWLNKNPEQYMIKFKV